MKTASTTARNEELQDALSFKPLRPIVRVEYKKQNDTAWSNFEDVQNVSFSKSSKNKKVGEFIIVPPSQSISVSLENSLRKYSPAGSGALSGVLDYNLMLRSSIGYLLDSAISVTYDVDESTGEFYHTQYDAGTNRIFNDISSEAAADTPNGLEGELTYYGDVNYDAGTYSAEGYYLSTVFDAFTNIFTSVASITVTSDTSDILLYVRSSDNADDLTDDFTPFVYAGATASGTSTITFTSTQNRYFQFAFVFATGEWVTAGNTSPGYITDIVINGSSREETFTQGEFSIDSASVNSSYNSKSASISGRDSVRKALERKVSTTAFTSADVADVIRYVCDRAGIPYTATSIQDTTYTVTIDEYSDKVASSILDEATFYLNSKSIKWQLYLDDAGDLTLKEVDYSLTSFDRAISYLYDIQSLSRNFNSDEAIKSVLVQSAEPSSKSEQAILGSGTYTTTGSKSITWVGDNIDIDFDFTYVSGDLRIDTDTIAYTATSVNFDIIGTSGEVAVTIRGEAVTTSGYYGQAVNPEFFESGFGHDVKITNRFFASNAECLTAAEKAIERFSPNADERWNVTASILADPRLEIGDRLIVIDKNTVTFDLFVIEAIQTSYTANGAQLLQNLSLRSLGATITDFDWDRNGAAAGTDDLDYDSGIFWDLDIFDEDSDTTDYSAFKRNYVR